MDDALVLIADDDAVQRLPMRVALEQAGFRVAEARDGEEALSRFQEQTPDLVILDVMMPGRDGFSVCQALRAGLAPPHLPVIMITSMSDIASINHAYEAGATDFITKPVNWALLSHRVRYVLRGARTAQALAQREEELIQTRLEIIRRLGQAAEFRDNETGQHIIRVSHYAALLGQVAGLDAESCTLLLHAAPMHDVGKIGIPDHILLKPGRLTPEEFERIKPHTMIGAQLLSGDLSDILRTAHTIALTHHEKWDGSGYPHGLKGEEIPLIGRICALADVFDALTSRRPYKAPWSVAEAMAEIQNQAGKHFDPRLTPLFISLLPEILRVMAQHGDEEP